MPSIADVFAAHAALRSHIRATPLLPYEPLGLVLKPECLQEGGAFKIRGATNRILAIPEAHRKGGVVAFSSGNHARAVALAARRMGISATIVMPEDSQPHKVRATREAGAVVVQDGVTVANRDEIAARITQEQGATLIPPYDDPWIVSGQGTAGLEILLEDPEVDAIVVPLGGGGLLSGIALAATSLKPGIRVYGVEPAAGDDGRRSLRAGRIVTIDAPDTIADGARTRCIGAVPWEVIRERVTDIVAVDDDALLQAMAALVEHARLVVEPTGALAVAAVMQGLVPRAGRTCAVLSGGNVSATMLGRALSTTAAR